MINKGGLSLSVEEAPHDRMSLICCGILSLHHPPLRLPLPSRIPLERDNTIEKESETN